MVRLGSAPDDYDQALMWGPATDGPRERRGVALVRPNDLGSAHLRYEGGTDLTAYVIGYFTNESRPVSTAGLYVPATPQRLYEGLLRPDEPVVIDDLEPTARTALLTVASPSTEAGRLGTFLVPASDGRITLTPSAEIESVVTLLGLFIGDEQ